MICINEKIGPFKIKRIWFHQATQKRGCTLLRLMRIPEPSGERPSRNELSYTVINSLTVDYDMLLSSARKTVRNEVRRAEKDGLEIIKYDSKELKKEPSFVDAFEQAYLEFAKKMNNEAVTSAYNRKKIDQYIAANCFMLTYAEKGNLQVYHAYVYDENEVVLIYSVSDFRDDTVDRNLAGRANRYLHFRDMLLFKDLGLSYYDWGNISDPENYNGIDIFKTSFGGTIEKRYNILLGGNLIGKAFVRIYDRIKGEAKK